MIYFNVNIENTWSQRWKNIWHRVYRTPFKNKFIEIECFKDNTIVSFTFRLTTQRDHSGLMVEAGLFGYSCLVNFYDNRHWDYVSNNWASQ